METKEKKVLIPVQVTRKTLKLLLSFIKTIVETETGSGKRVNRQFTLPQHDFDDRIVWDVS